MKKNIRIVAQITDYRRFIINTSTEEEAIEAVAKKLKEKGIEATAFRVEQPEGEGQ